MSTGEIFLFFVYFFVHFLSALITFSFAKLLLFFII